MSLSPIRIFEHLAPDCMKLHIEIVDDAWYLDGELYLTTEQAAARTGMSRASIRNLTPRVHSIKLTPRLWLISALALDEYDKSKKKSGRPRKGQKNHKSRGKNT